MGQRVLFNKQDIYDFVELQKAKLKEAYARLADEQALDQEYTEEMKKKFSLEVPTLKPDQWNADDGPTETVIYVPFDGDPSAFNVAPSANNGTVATGEIVGNELLLRISRGYELNVAEYAKREIAVVEWHLYHLRGSLEYLKQQLDVVVAGCVAERRRSVERRALLNRELGIPRRQATELAGTIRVQRHEPPKQVAPAAPQEPAGGMWDVFVSHASQDKPYVKPLVDKLLKAGVRVWYDEHVFGWGDPLRTGINKGLLNSRYAIVVLSKAFLAVRKWTEHELDGLFAREKVGKLLILPIWHGIGRDELLNYDPALADRLAKVTETDSYADIVESVLKVLARDKQVPPGENGRRSTPATNQESDKRETVAYAWYEQKGPGAQKAKLSIRKSSFLRDGYVLIDGEQEHDGTEQDVATRFFAADRWLQSQGYVRTHFSNLSGKPAFNV